MLQLTNKDYAMTFSIDNDYGDRLFLNTSLFNLELNQMRCIKQDGQFSCKANQYQLQPCDINDLKPEFKNDLTTMIGLDALYFLPQNITYDFEGYWDENIIKFITFALRLCRNDTS